MAHGQAVVLFFFAVLLHSRLALLGRGYGTAQGVRNQSGVPTAACHGALPRFWKIKQNKYYMRCMCVFHHGTLSMHRTTWWWLVDPFGGVWRLGNVMVLPTQILRSINPYWSQMWANVGISRETRLGRTNCIRHFYWTTTSRKPRTVELKPPIQIDSEVKNQQILTIVHCTWWHPCCFFLWLKRCSPRWLTRCTWRCSRGAMTTLIEAFQAFAGPGIMRGKEGSMLERGSGMVMMVMVMVKLQGTRQCHAMSIYLKLKKNKAMSIYPIYPIVI